MSEQETIDAIKTGMMHAARNQAANELRQPIAQAVVDIAQAQPVAPDAGVLCCALMMVASDFMIHHCPESYRNTYMRGMADLFVRCVQQKPSEPL